MYIGLRKTHWREQLYKHHLPREPMSVFDELEVVSLPRPQQKRLTLPLKFPVFKLYDHQLASLMLLVQPVQEGIPLPLQTMSAFGSDKKLDDEVGLISDDQRLKFRKTAILQIACGGGKSMIILQLAVLILRSVKPQSKKHGNVLVLVDKGTAVTQLLEDMQQLIGRNSTNSRSRQWHVSMITKEKNTAVINPDGSFHGPSIVIMTYPNVAYGGQRKRSALDELKSLFGTHWLAVILDEAQHARTPKRQTVLKRLKTDLMFAFSADSISARFNKPKKKRKRKRAEEKEDLDSEDEKEEEEFPAVVQHEEKPDKLRVFEFDEVCEYDRTFLVEQGLISDVKFKLNMVAQKRDENGAVEELEGDGQLDQNVVDYIEHVVRDGLRRKRKIIVYSTRLGQFTEKGQLASMLKRVWGEHVEQSSSRLYTKKIKPLMKLSGKTSTQERDRIIDLLRRLNDGAVAQASGVFKEGINVSDINEVIVAQGTGAPLQLAGRAQRLDASQITPLYRSVTTLYGTWGKLAVQWGSKSMLQRYGAFEVTPIHVARKTDETGEDVWGYKQIPADLFQRDVDDPNNIRDLMLTLRQQNERFENEFTEAVLEEEVLPVDEDAVYMEDD